MADPIVNLRTHRRTWALGQDELARLLGIAQSSYARIESGERLPDVQVLIRLQVVFGLSARDILPALYHQIEEEVMAHAAMLDRKWSQGRHYGARQKLRLLERMALRAKDNGLEA